MLTVSQEEVLLSSHSRVALSPLPHRCRGWKLAAEKSEENPLHLSHSRATRRVLLYTTSDCLQETPVIKLSYKTENTGRLNTRQFTKDHQNPLTPCRTRPVYELTREADQLSSAAVDLARLVAVLCPVGGHVGDERVKSGPSGRAPEFEASFCSGQNRVMTSSRDALWP